MTLLSHKIGFRLLSRKQNFIATFEHVMRDMFQCGDNKPAHDGPTLLCVGGTFLKLRFLSSWWMPTQCKQTTVDGNKIVPYKIVRLQIFMWFANILPAVIIQSGSHAHIHIVWFNVLLKNESWNIPFVDELPTAEHTGLPAQVVSAANSAVEWALESAYVDCVKWKRNYAKTFTGEDRAKVGKYAAENGVTRYGPL